MNNIILSLINKAYIDCEMYYTFANEDSTIIRKYSHSFMTKWVQYPQSMLDQDGFLREGVFVQFYVKRDAMGRTSYVPDQSKYWQKHRIEQDDTNTSFNTTPQYSTVILDYSDKQEFDISIIAATRSRELIRSALNRINSFNNSQKEQLVDSLVLNDISRACSLICNVLDISPFPDESQTLEYKEGIDYKVIAKETLGFANSHTVGTIICGIRDQTKEVIGVENMLIKKGLALEPCLTSLLHTLSQTISNVDFTQSLKIEWYQFEGHLLLVINIPRWEGHFLSFSGKDLFMRKGAMNKSLSAVEALTIK